MQGPDIKIALLLAAVAAGAIGAIVYNVLPLYLGPLQDSAGLSNSQLGLIAGAYFLGSNLTGISSYFWVRRVSPRYAAIAATLLLIAFLLLAANFDSFVLQIFSTVLIGGASGALYAISATIIGDAHNTPRWFGIKFTIECLAGVVLLYVLPVTLIPGLGFTGVVYGMVIMILVFSPALLYLSRRRLPAPQEDTSTSVTRAKASRLPVWLALAALLFYFIGASAIWAFLERLATNNNFEPSAIGALLGTTLFFCRYRCCHHGGHW